MIPVRVTTAAQFEEFNARCRELIGREYPLELLQQVQCHGIQHKGRLVSGWIVDLGARMYLQDLSETNRMELLCRFGSDNVVGVQGWWMSPEVKNPLVRCWLNSWVVYSILTCGRKYLVAGAAKERVFNIYRRGRPLAVYEGKVQVDGREIPVHIAVGRWQELMRGFAIQMGRRLSKVRVGIARVEQNATG